METRDTIRSIFSGLGFEQQQALLDELLQEHELQGKIIDAATADVLATRGKKPCPHCHNTKVYKRGKQNNVQMYQCRYCDKWYSETTGTPLWDIKLKSKWQGYLRCMEKGMSLKAISEELGICIRTSFDWRHKILGSLDRFVPQTLSGVVESDELELALSHKGARDLERAPRKRGTDFKRNTGTDDVTVVQVVTAVERKGETFLKAVESKRLTSQEIDKAFGNKLAQGTVLVTDSHVPYKSYAKSNPRIKHKTFISKDHTDKKDRSIHVQAVNKKHKEWRDFLDPFNGVSSKYPQNYLNWFAYADKLRQTKSTLKQWIVGGLSASQAYDLFWLFKENAVNIRI